MQLCLTKNSIKQIIIKHTLANKGTDLWNNLPLQYKEIGSFPKVKATLKKNFRHRDIDK